MKLINMKFVIFIILVVVKAEEKTDSNHDCLTLTILLAVDCCLSIERLVLVIYPILIRYRVLSIGHSFQIQI